MASPEQNNCEEIISTEHIEKLFNKLRSQYVNKSGKCDAILATKKNNYAVQEFHVHKLMLSYESSYFKTFLQTGYGYNDESGAYICQDINPRVMETIISYAYGQNISLSCHDFTETLHFAHFYGFDKLHDSLVKILLAIRPTINSVSLLNYGTFIQCDSIETTMFKVVVDNFAGLAEFDEDFTEMNAHLLARMITSDQLPMNENELFCFLQSLMRKADGTSRAEQIRKLFKFIKWQLLNEENFQLYLSLMKSLRVDCSNMKQIQNNNHVTLRKGSHCYIFIHTNDTMILYDLSKNIWKVLSPEKLAELKPKLFYAVNCHSCTIDNQSKFVGLSIPMSVKYSIGLNHIELDNDQWRKVYQPTKCHGLLLSSPNGFVVSGSYYPSSISSITVSKEFQASKEVHQYSFETKSWTQLPSLEVARLNHSCAYSNGTLFVTGGEMTDQFEFLSYGASKWSRGPPLEVARFNHAMVTHYNALYVAGGCKRDSETLNSVEMLIVDDPYIEKNNWTLVQEMISPRMRFNLVCDDNYLYVIGGDTNGSIERLPLLDYNRNQDGDRWSYVTKRDTLRMPNCSARIVRKCEMEQVEHFQESLKYIGDLNCCFFVEN